MGDGQISALSFLYRKTLGQPERVSFLSRPRCKRPLPTVLSLEEVGALIGAIRVARYHLDRCESCGYEHPSYNSCRNRHCPKCQALAQEIWIDARRQRMLDVRHFHVVFTLPSELRPLARFAPRVVFEALFHAAQRTLLEFGPSRLHATVGATLVLHTWTRTLTFHPHVHAIVTAGGLSSNGESWHATSRRFLFSVDAMGRVFRGKRMTALGRAYDDGAFAHLHDFRDPQAFLTLMGRLAKRWNVYAKAPFKASTSFRTWAATPTVSASPTAACSPSPNARSRFARRAKAPRPSRPSNSSVASSSTSLPDGLQRSGTSASMPPASARRERARSRLGDTGRNPPRTGWRERLKRLTGRDVGLCPHCGGRRYTVVVPSSVMRKMGISA